MLEKGHVGVEAAESWAGGELLDPEQVVTAQMFG